MSESESVEPLPPPDDEMWFFIDVVVNRELYGGHQSRVFAAERNGDLVVVKLVDSRLVDNSFRRRIEMTSRLAEANETVVAPIPSNEALVTDLGGWLAVIYPYGLRCHGIAVRGHVKVLGGGQEKSSRW